MEQFNDRRDPGRDDRNFFSGGSFHALIPGIILVAIGAIFLLDNLHIVHANSLWEYWPVVLIAVGLVQVVDADHVGRRTAGIVMIAVGAVFLGSNLGYITFDIGDLWPLILIGIGLLMLWNRIGWGGERDWWGWGRGNRWRDDFSGIGMGRSQTRSYSGSDLNEFAIFGASRRIVNSADFRVGQASCIFGGITLDLTAANMAANTAELRLSAVYGGIVVKIPTSWNAEVRGGGVFGGFVDRTIHPPATPDMKRLFIRGGAVFGGVTIKN